MAELTVRVDGNPGSVETTYNYEFRALNADGTGPLEQEHTVTPSPDLVRLSCERIDAIVGDPAGTEQDLVAAGQLLYRALFPSSDGGVPELVGRLRNAGEPLLVRTNESLVPWELLHDGTDFLALTRDVARRTFVKRRVVDGRTIDGVRRALVVGDPKGDLPAARGEAEQLASWLGDLGVDRTLLVGADATLLRVLSELSAGGYDLLHYCGHVAAPVGTSYVGLLLHDKQLLDARALEPLTGSGVPPIVFVNGCASADRLTNLCVSFMMLGAKIVVGTRYPVGEEPARQFAERFYTEVVAGSTAAAAVRSARRAVRHGATLDWSAFVLYGDPLIRVTVGESQPPAAADVSPPSSVDAYRFDAAAKAVMGRMMRMAAPMGIATSMDLLSELLATDDMRARAAATVGVARVARVDELLHTLREHMSALATDSGADVELSGTVSNVLARAERGAQEAGRDLISTADLVTAFLAVGGGSSAQVCEAFGFSLSELAGGPPTRPRAENGRQDVLFDESGELREELLTPAVAGAVRVAGMLAAANGTVISTGMLLYGLAIAGGGVLRDGLRAQGEPGAVALDKLSMASGVRRSLFSSRTRRALQRLAAADPTQPVDEAAILRELLTDPSSSARRTLAKLSVDVDALLPDRHGLPDEDPPSTR